MGEAPALSGEALARSFDGLVEDLRQATYDPRTAERLALVGTTCALRVAGHEQLEVWLRLDSSPVEVDDRPGDADPEVTITIPPRLVDRFWDEELAMVILQGEATFTGPVRQVLQVYPVLRAAGRARRAETTHATTEAA